MEFEESYLFSTNCHMCKKYFDDLHEYKDHLQQHYDKDSNKTWLQCDFGCTKNETGISMPVLSSSVGNFIAHITKHTKTKPFKCNVIVNGIKCTNSATTKGNLRNHWKSMHFTDIDTE
eukprot:UN03554